MITIVDYVKIVIGINYKFSSLFGEIKEIFEALFALDVPEAIKETQQVVLMIQLMLYQRLNIITPITTFTLPIVEEHAQRVLWFRDLFIDKGIPFKPEFLRYGSNYAKQWKVAKAIQLGLEDMKLHENSI